MPSPLRVTVSAARPVPPQQGEEEQRAQETPREQASGRHWKKKINLTKYLVHNPEVASLLRDDPTNLAPLADRPGLQNLVHEHPQVLHEVLATVEADAATCMLQMEAKVAAFLANNPEIADQLRADPTDLAPLSSCHGIRKMLTKHPQVLLKMLDHVEANPAAFLPVKQKHKPAKLLIFLANNPDLAAQLTANPTDLTPLDGRPGLLKFVKQQPHTLQEMLRRFPEMTRRMEAGKAPPPMLSALRRRIVRFLANHPDKLQQLQTESSTKAVEEIFGKKPFMLRFLQQDPSELPDLLVRAEHRMHSKDDASDTELDETATDDASKVALGKCLACNFSATGVTPGFCCVKCGKTGGRQHGRRCLGITNKEVTSSDDNCWECVSVELPAV